jgi:hypothetical protein
MADTLSQQEQTERVANGFDPLHWQRWLMTAGCLRRAQPH